MVGLPGVSLLTILGGSLLFLLTPQETEEVDDMKWQAYETGDLVKQAKESGKAWLPFLDNETLITGIYRLEAGATDTLSPHDLDEVYYVVEGAGAFEVNDERRVVNPGTILFVKAGEAHRFVEIQKDLTVLVFFSKVKDG